MAICHLLIRQPISKYIYTPSEHKCSYICHGAISFVLLFLFDIDTKLMEGTITDIGSINIENSMAKLLLEWIFFFQKLLAIRIQSGDKDLRKRSNNKMSALKIDID